MEYNEKQLHILKTAEQLFAMQGFAGTSIRDIAEAAGVNVAMISYYFGSKDKMIEALFELRTSHIRLRLENLLKDETLNPYEKVCTVIDEYIARVAEKLTFYKVMLFEQVLEKNTVITQHLNELKRQNTELVEKIIKEGQRKKVFQKKVDTVLLMNTLYGISMHTYINKVYYKTYHGLQEMPEEAFQKVLQEKLSNHIKVLFKAILGYEE